MFDRGVEVARTCAGIIKHDIGREKVCLEGGLPKTEVNGS